MPSASHRPPALGSTVFFAGVTSRHGLELWASDGSPGGTHPVTDLSYDGPSSDPQKLVALGESSSLR
ncbi:MAG TPA: hypothetical protein VFC23_21605, partial [Thermoanaerobaculia bacterium]|nr:hypothetical protein [Thermoanaerobaculia bacterium]